jgi:hypothetical protein
MNFFKFTIRHNSAKCLICGQILVSKSKKLITCKCKNLSIAGGNKFFQRIAEAGIFSYQELWAIRASKEYKDFKKKSKKKSEK